MTTEASCWPAGLLRLRDAISARLDGLHGVDRPFFHNRATIRDVAAHVLAVEALHAGRRKRGVKDFDALADAAVTQSAPDLVEALRAHVAFGKDRFSLKARPDDEHATRSFDGGTNSFNVLGCRAYVSPVADGILQHMPTARMAEDDLAWVRDAFRSEILRLGGSEASSRRADIEAHDDGRIVFLMPDGEGDPGLHMRDHLQSAAHRSDARISEIVAHHARKVAVRDRERRRCVDERDNIRAFVEEAIGGVDGMAVESISLYTASEQRQPNGTLKTVFIFHAAVSHVNAMLRPSVERYVFRSDYTDADRTGMAGRYAKLAAGHAAAMKAREADGLRWDSISLALAERIVGGAEAIESQLAEKPDGGSLKGAKGLKGRAKAGRVTLRVPIGTKATWKYEELEIRGMVLPKTTALGIVGRTGAEVIDDPAFTDEVVKSVKVGMDRTTVRFRPRWIDRKRSGEKG